VEGGRERARRRGRGREEEGGRERFTTTRVEQTHLQQALHCALQEREV
jgi:hypothetical protein